MNLDIKRAQSALSLSEAAKRIPGRPSTDTLRRWINKGLSGGVKLEAFRSGGALFTTEEAIERFLAAQNAGAISPRRHEVAESELRAMGI
jgi:hypothetical protein